MDEFPKNSILNKEEMVQPKPEVTKKRVEKVVEGEVIRKKRPVGSRIKDLFIGGDSKTAGEYVLYDVLLPAAKDAIADAMSQGIERILFGEARSTSRRPKSRYSTGHVSYNRMSQRSAPWDARPEHSRTMTRQARATHDFQDIILETRVEAEQVIDRLFDVVSKYESATVADLYDLVGITGDYTDNKWGWTDIRSADVKRVRNGYLLDLPRPEPLD